VIAAEGRLEEEMYLTSFLWEEAKHVELFHRFLREVAEVESDLSSYLTPSYAGLFGEELPNALGRLRTDSSPEAQAEASVTYNMIVEGVLAETGYYAYQQMLMRNGIMPGMQVAVGHLRGDESRHMAYGVFLLSRLVAEHGEPLWRVIEERLNHLLPLSVGVIHELFALYDPMPFGLDLDDFVGYAMSQFQKRSRRIERSRGQTLEEVLRLGSEGSAEPEGAPA
jgi:ribonucleoside-diphosphate reductase beta chain